MTGGAFADTGSTARVVVLRLSGRGTARRRNIRNAKRGWKERIDGEVFDAFSVAPVAGRDGRRRDDTPETEASMVAFDLLFWIGRILFSAIFIFSGLGHFMQLDGMSQYAGSKGVPAPRLMVMMTGVIILLGGLSVLFWVWVEVGAWLLILFLLIAAVKMHDYWNVADPQEKQTQQAHFMKNLALAGAALVFYTLQQTLEGAGTLG